MKHYYHVSRIYLNLSLCILLGMNSCDTNETHSAQKDATVQPMAASQDTLPVPLKDDCTVISNIHRIEKPNVLTYLTAFWNDTKCVEFAESVGFSGVYVNVDHDKLPKALAFYEGYTSFFCVDDNNNPYVALKFDEVCPGSIEPHVAITPDDKFLKGEYKLSIIPSNSRTGANLENYLKAIKIPPSAISTQPKGADPADVIGDNFKYKSLIWNDGTYAKYGFSFVHKLQMENWLLVNSQGVQIAGYVCFLGFSGTAANEKVRQILVPVSTTGSLLLESPFYCLEKSWPPIDPQISSNAVTQAKE